MIGQLGWEIIDLTGFSSVLWLCRYGVARCVCVEGGGGGFSTHVLPSDFSTFHQAIYFLYYKVYYRKQYRPTIAKMREVMRDKQLEKYLHCPYVVRTFFQ